MQLLLTVLIVCPILIIKDVKALTKSGPFAVVPTRFDTCEDVGTNQVRFGNRMSSKGNGVFTYTNNITFDVPWDDKLKMEIEVQQLNNGAFTPKFMTQTMKNCDYVWKYGKALLKSTFDAAGYNFTKCPLPAGTYFVKDWEINIELSQIPSFIYGSYKTIIAFSKDKKRVGCFVMYDEVVPK